MAYIQDSDPPGTATEGTRSMGITPPIPPLSKATLPGDLYGEGISVTLELIYGLAVNVRRKGSNATDGGGIAIDGLNDVDRGLNLGHGERLEQTDIAFPDPAEDALLEKPGRTGGGIDLSRSFGRHEFWCGSLVVRPLPGHLGLPLIWASPSMICFFATGKAFASPFQNSTDALSMDRFGGISMVPVRQLIRMSPCSVWMQK